MTSSSITDRREGLPLVSIITPVKNGAKYLDQCITSLLDQDYPHIEHVIVDGGSTDGTVDILSAYHQKYPERVTFISEPDRGSGDAWNKGMRMARGDIFNELGADDMSEPGAIRAVVDFFNESPGAFFVFGSCIYIDARGEVISRPATKAFDLQQITKSWCWVPTPSSFYRREVIEKVGYLDELGNDLDLLIRIGKQFPVHRMERVLSNFRVHEGSATTGANKKVRKMWLREDCRVSRRHGGGAFSGYCIRYYRFPLVEGLRPILGFTYPFFAKVLDRFGHK